MKKDKVEIQLADIKASEWLHRNGWNEEWRHQNKVKGQKYWKFGKN